MIEPVIGQLGFMAMLAGLSLAGAVVAWLVFLLPHHLLTSQRVSLIGVCEQGAMLLFGCALGLIVGVSTGLSRAPAVSATVPAILTIVGALIGYVWSTGTLNQTARFTVLASAIVLTFAFAGGAAFGAAVRLEADTVAKRFELEKMKYASELRLHEKAFDAKVAEGARQHSFEIEVLKAAAVGATRDSGARGPVK